MEAMEYEFEAMEDEDWVDEFVLSGSHQVVTMVRDTWKNLQTLKEEKRG